jgi:hypothetical protein
MSVHDPEPKVPNDDNGRGIRGIGWFLLFWVVVSFIWVPPGQWFSNLHGESAYIPRLLLALFVSGAAFVIAGYIVSYRSRSETSIQEEAHDKMMASEDGADQHDLVA